jgi:hypothetical protein
MIACENAALVRPETTKNFFCHGSNFSGNVADLRVKLTSLLSSVVLQS